MVTIPVYKNNDPPIVVIGAGPSGLALALGVLDKGYKVLLVTKYPYVTRAQRMKLDNATMKTLEKYYDKKNPKDIKFFNELKRSQSIFGGTHSVGSIERFLLRKVDDKIAAGMHITKIDERSGSLKDVNLNEQKVTITIKTKSDDKIQIVKNETTQEVPFLHLIDASGSRRTAFQLVADKDKDKKEEISEKLNANIHLAQGTAIFRIDEDKKKAFPQLDKKEVNFLFPKTVHIPKLSNEEVGYLKKEFKWEYDFPPNTYIITNADRTKFYVGGDIPSSILQIEDKAVKREQVEAWSRYILERHFNINDTKNDLTIVKEVTQAKIDKYKEKYNLDDDEAKRAATSKINLSVTAFSLENLSRVKDPIRNVSTNEGEVRVFAGIGDTMQDPYFHKAHGVNDAFTEVNEFLNCLPDKKSKRSFNLDSLSKLYTKLTKQHDERLKDSSKEHAAKQSHFALENKSMPENNRLSESKNAMSEVIPEKKDIIESFCDPIFRHALLLLTSAKSANDLEECKKFINESLVIIKSQIDLIIDECPKETKSALIEKLLLDKIKSGLNIQPEDTAKKISLTSLFTKKAPSVPTSRDKLELLNKIYLQNAPSIQQAPTHQLK